VFANAEIEEQANEVQLGVRTVAAMNGLILEREAGMRNEFAEQTTTEWLDYNGVWAKALTLVQTLRYSKVPAFSPPKGNKFCIQNPAPGCKLFPSTRYQARLGPTG